jgi:phosphatidylglycerophosphate synthase
MSDIDFSYAMLVIVCAAFGLYAVRAAFWGRARHERADKDGGSVFVGKRFMEFGYWLMDPVVVVLDQARVTPDMVTAFSLLPAMAAGVAVSRGWFGLGCLLATGASLCDSVAGLLARRQGSASDAGEAFDAVVDRYVEFFFMGGLVIYYRFSLGLCTLAIAALFGAFMVSYSTAKAEALGVAPPRGSMRRAERAIYLLFAAGLTPFAMLLAQPDAPLIVRQAPIIFATGLIAVVANVSVIRRLRAIVQAIRGRDGRPSSATQRVEGATGNSLATPANADGSGSTG